MGLFSGQLSNVIEWQEYRDDIIFWKWNNNEIKKGSRLIIRQGQNAIFMFNGKVEGIFTEEGNYDVESEIIPFLSTLKGFKFGFNSGMRSEVLFINTKEFEVKWGTKNPISIPAPGLPGGMPICAFGSFIIKVDDYLNLIDKVAGVKDIYKVEDVKERVIARLDPLLMKWIVREGKDMFNLQGNGVEIGDAIGSELDQELQSIGIAVMKFDIQSFTYPKEIQKMQEKAASHSMVGDMQKYQQMAAADSFGNTNNRGGSNVASDMVNLQMGMAMGQQMVEQMKGGNNQSQSPAQQQAQALAAGAVNFCPNCGTKAEAGNFCSSCGYKLR